MDKQSLILIAMELDLPSILNFCQSEKNINRSVCKNKFFWINKMKKDYNFILKNLKDSNDPKQYYKILYNSRNNPGIGLEISALIGYDDLVEYFLKKDVNSHDIFSVIKKIKDKNILDILIPKIIDIDPYFNKFDLEEVLLGKKLFDRYKKYLIRKYFKNLIDAIDENNDMKIKNIIDNDLYDFEIYLDYNKENILTFIKDHYKEYF